MRISIKEIEESVWEIDSGNPGKRVCVVGGTHGNELTGIELIKRIVSEIRNGRITIANGVLYLVIGNPSAVARGTRGSQDHHDLNRRFTRDVLQKPDDGTYELSRAKQLAPIYAACDIVIDIHSTNKPSEPMLLCTNFSEAYVDLFKWFEGRRVVSDPFTAMIGEPSTGNDWTALNGGLGMAYESGQASDISKVGELTESIFNILREQQLVNEPFSREPSDAKWDKFDLIESVVMTNENFCFAPGRGERSFESFQEGDLLAHMGGKPILAPYEGVILFPKIKELQSVGTPVMFYAKRK